MEGGLTKVCPLPPIADRDADDQNDASRALLTRMNQQVLEILSKKAWFTSKQRSSSHPTTTSTPAFRNRAMPPPSTKGLGSPIPTTTRRTPASINACEQGGVRPKWSQGSSVT